MLYIHQEHAFCHLYQSVNVCYTHAHAWHMFVWESEADVLQVIVKYIYYVCLRQVGGWVPQNNMHPYSNAV